MENVRGFAMGLGAMKQPFAPSLTDTVNNLLRDYGTVERVDDVFALEVQLPSSRRVPVSVRVFEDLQVVGVQAGSTLPFLDLQLPRVLAILHAINKRLAFGSFVFTGGAVLFRDAVQIESKGRAVAQVEAMLNRLEFPLEVWRASYQRLGLANIAPETVAHLAFVELGAVPPDPDALGKTELKALFRVIR